LSEYISNTMQLKYLWILLIFTTYNTLKAQSLNCNDIPDSLKENADAVVRFDNTVVTIQNLNKVIIRHEYAITVLNEKGNDYAEYYKSYDPMNVLNEATGVLYDATGKKLRSVKKKEMTDEPYNDYISLTNDTRIKSFNFYYRTYPYTVVYTDEITQTNTFQLPYWKPILGSNCSVMQSRFQVAYPNSKPIQYKILKASIIQFDSSNNSNTKTYTWQLSGYKSSPYEPLQPNRFERNPYVFIGATHFQLQNYKGSMDSWNNYGKFINELNSNRNQLPEVIQQQVHQIVDSLSTRQQKIIALYQFMQKNTRYINITLGIGGWQPYDCAYVANNKYGDCKALSNYMVALLNEVGIKAYYVLIHATDNHFPFFHDFPNAYFNHATVCVPNVNGADTLWLECTDATMPAGYVSDFTDDRDALMITDTGGVIVHTPIYSINQNQESRMVQATLNEKGDLIAQVHARYEAQPSDAFHELLNFYTPEKIQEYYNRVFSLPTYTVSHIQLKEEKKVIPVVNESFDIQINGYASVTGKRLFIKPNIFDRWQQKLEPDENRTNNIVINKNFVQSDTIYITVPSEYEVESLPQPIQLNTQFGNYNIAFSFNHHTIQVIRKQVSIKQELPASTYGDLVNYYNTISNADVNQMVLVKKAN
jgi:hypothetical protein